jgi:tRNA(Ile)-lysidine synthetase-like protein
MRSSLPAPADDGVLVAVSGGADSTSLALRLHDARIAPLHLAHVVHGLRPLEAAADLALVRDLASRLGRPLHVVELTPPPSFRVGDKVPEAWARERRYGALLELARRLGLRVVATGHHAADRRETQLLHLLRGGGLRALAGMSEWRTLAADASIWLWRPSLECEPESLRDDLRARGQAWREDATNRDERLARGRLRHRVVPWLRSRGDPLLARLDMWSRRATHALGALERACDRELDRAWPSARAHCLLLPEPERLARLAPTAWIELLLAASRRVLENAPARSLRRRELLELVRWLRESRQRGRRRVGPLELERSRDRLAIYDATRCVATWRATVRDSASTRRSIVVRPLALGDGLGRFAASLPPVERVAWPAVLVDGTIAWVPQLWPRRGPGGSTTPPSLGRAAISIDGLPDLATRR